MNFSWIQMACAMVCLVGGLLETKPVFASDLSGATLSPWQPNLSSNLSLMEGDESFVDTFFYGATLKGYRLLPAFILGAGWTPFEGWSFVKGGIGAIIATPEPNPHVFEVNLDGGVALSRWHLGLRAYYRPHVIYGLFGLGVQGRYLRLWNGADSYLHGGVTVNVAAPLPLYVSALQIDLSYRHVLTNPLGDLNNGFFISLSLIMIFWNMTT